MTHKRNIATLILAAGKGSRMKSNKPKVMHELAGAPLIHYVVVSAEALNPTSIHTIIAPGMEESVGRAVSPHDVIFQTEQKGTGHAVLQARDALKNFNGQVLLMLGDVPMIKSETIKSLLETMARQNNSIQLLSFCPEDPTGYGRVITDAQDKVEAIIEHKDCTESQKAVNRVWSGIMAVDGAELFTLLDQMSDDNAQNEYYLTEIVEIANRMGFSVGFTDCDLFQVQGVNTKKDLAALEVQVQASLRDQHMARGVTLIDPQSVTFSVDTIIGADTVIEPNVYFGRGVVVGEECRIRAFSHIEGAIVGDACEIGPFARLREDTKLDGHNVIGNFVETKKSDIAKGTKIKHLSYIGNAFVGEKSNLGAGTITCNYNGYEKFETHIGDHVSTGVNTVCVAPISIGDHAITAAGSVLTKDVPAEALSIARAEQANREGWAKRFHNAHRAKKDKKSA